MTHNRLGQETSPYLLQHKDHPVHWQPWDKQAFAEARAGNKLILLSIGYAACHWCHMMAYESFENPETARVMNESCVMIEVDREERPDIEPYLPECPGRDGRTGRMASDHTSDLRGHAVVGRNLISTRTPLRTHGLSRCHRYGCKCLPSPAATGCTEHGCHAPGITASVANERPQHGPVVALV